MNFELEEMNRSGSYQKWHYTITQDFLCISNILF